MRTGVPTGLLVGVALLGCTSAVTELVKVPSKPAGCSVQIFQDEAAVTRPHEAVCRINSTLIGPVPVQLSDSNMPDEVRRLACGCGGDGVVLPAPDGGTMVTVIRYTGS